MKKFLILLLLLHLPLFFSCTDSSSPSEEKKTVKPAPAPEPIVGCESSNDCENGVCTPDHECVECMTNADCAANGGWCENNKCVYECNCASDCVKEGYGCYDHHCGCGSAGHECSEGQICVNGNCAYPAVGLDESCDATHPCATGLSCSSDGKCEREE